MQIREFAQRIQSATLSKQQTQEVISKHLPNCVVKSTVQIHKDD